jgi:hypothetical protein
MPKHQNIFALRTDVLLKQLEKRGKTVPYFTLAIARKAEVGRGAVRRWVKRFGGVNSANRQIVCEYLGLPEDQLFDVYDSQDVYKDGVFRIPESSPVNDSKVAVQTSPEKRVLPHRIMIAYSKAPADIQEAVEIVLDQYL